MSSDAIVWRNTADGSYCWRVGATFGSAPTYSAAIHATSEQKLVVKSKHRRVSERRGANEARS